MFNTNKVATMLITAGVLGCACTPASAAVRIEGQVQAGGGGIANSSVTLWAASAGGPRQLAQARTNGDGQLWQLVGSLRARRFEGRNGKAYQNGAKSSVERC